MHACRVTLCRKVIVTAELRFALEKLVALADLILEVDDMIIKLTTDLAVLRQLVSILLVCRLQRVQSLVPVAKDALQRIELHAGLLLIVMIIALTLLSLPLHLSRLYLHLLLEFLHLRLTFSKQLSDLRREMVFLLTKKSLELILASRFLVLNLLKLAFEFSSPLTNLLTKSLLFSLELTYVLSQILTFFLDLDKFLSALHLNFFELFALLISDFIKSLLYLLKLLLRLQGLTLSKILGVE